MRGSVWLFLANGSIRRRPGLFETLCKTSQGARGKKGKEAAYDSIDKDLHRCFPDHKLFRGENSTGRADLEAILKAYVHYSEFYSFSAVAYATQKYQHRIVLPSRRRPQIPRSAIPKAWASSSAGSSSKCLLKTHSGCSARSCENHI